MSTALGSTVRQRLRRARGPLVIAAVILLAAILLTVVSARSDAGLLQPGAVDPEGSAALVTVLRDQGVTVDVATRPDEVAAGPGTTVLVAFPERLTAAGRDALAASGADLVLVAPDPFSLEALAPGVRGAETPPPLLTPDDDGTAPACDVPAARAAGTITADGAVYEIASPAVGCFPRAGVAPLALSGRTTVVGDPAPFTNDALADAGNAALTTRLLGAHPRLVWYLPTVLPDDGGGGSAVALVPPGWIWGSAGLLLAAGVLALAQGRRLGPLVPERLPVRVSAAETTRGRAGLYRRIGARGRAAEVLRADARRRLAARLGLPAGAGPDALAGAVAAAAGGYTRAEVADLLGGATPPDDRALVTLAGRLDDLRGAVGGAAPAPARDTTSAPTTTASATTTPTTTGPTNPATTPTSGAAAPREGDP